VFRSYSADIPLIFRSYSTPTSLTLLGEVLQRLSVSTEPVPDLDSPGSVIIQARSHLPIKV
jgi:hypothetical protein